MENAGRMSEGYSGKPYAYQAAGKSKAFCKRMCFCSGTWLAAEGKKFDIIFMDPPYEAGLYTSVLERIAENGLLKAEGYLIAEGSSQIALTIPKGMKILREKVYKTTTLTFLCAEEENV